MFELNLRTFTDEVQATPPGERHAVSRNACIHAQRQSDSLSQSAPAGHGRACVYTCRITTHLSFTRSHSNQPHVCVSAGAVGELWFRAVPGGPDIRLARHIKRTSTHSRRTCTSRFAQDKHRCMLSLQRVENIIPESLSTVAVCK